jgi:hypothetical protein
MFDVFHAARRQAKDSRSLIDESVSDGGFGPDKLICNGELAFSAQIQ